MPKLPMELEGALESLYDNYKIYHRAWEKSKEQYGDEVMPPVFIVVCNNTNVSKLVFDYIAGWTRESEGEETIVPGKLSLFSNVENRAWLSKPKTILIDSEQLESGDAMSDDFKKMASREIEEFKAEYHIRFPEKDVSKITDEDLLREVMNTIGKPGKLGEQVKCVVSVSMLTEGWDANTVTHILGVRAFGTQLLCEQVIGRGLRRRSYAVNSDGKFEPEYAEVYGVPFSFIPCAGSSKGPVNGNKPTRVRALEERADCEITFPRLTGYRYDIAEEKLSVEFDEKSVITLSTEQVPTKVENSPIVGETSIHTLDELKNRRIQEVVFLLAKLTLERYFRHDGKNKLDKPSVHTFDGEVKYWLFPQLLNITRRWLDECVSYKDNTFPQLLLLLEYAYLASDKIYTAIIGSHAGKKTLKPILKPYDPVGSTNYVDFETARSTFRTRPGKCHISHVVADTDSWEQKAAQSIEEMPGVRSYAKNHNVGFFIPYTFNGIERKYIPDFIIRFDDGPGPDDLLNIIVEISGQADAEKDAKVATARNLWIPAVNNHGAFGRWAFIEIKDPWNFQNILRIKLENYMENKKPC